MKFEHTVLDNGLEIIGEPRPAAHSTAVGFFVRTGARDESQTDSGVSHFLEHMAFKGDDTFSAADVNRIFDEVGASYNASTSEEITFYYAAILPEYLQQTFELLATLMRPSLRADDFHLEKQVILEEIGMYEDIPTMAVYERVMGLHFQGHPLGQSILGSSASITALTPEQMRAYHESRYGAGNLVLAATGSFEWEQLVDLAQQHCGDWQRGQPGRKNDEAAPVSQASWMRRPEMHQQHVMQMAPAPAAQDEMRFTAEIVSTIVGDDGGGRIYWDLVETGLAESADLGYADFDGSGAWVTYLCCHPKKTKANLRRIGEIYREFNRSGATEEEFEQARTKVAARVVLAGERPMGRLLTLGHNWVYRREYRSVADDLQTVKSLSVNAIPGLLERYPLDQLTTVGLGPLAKL